MRCFLPSGSNASIDFVLGSYFKRFKFFSICFFCLFSVNEASKKNSDLSISMSNNDVAS